MISGKENLLQWFKIQESPVFSIFRKGHEKSGNVLYTNKHDDDVDMETATAFLEKCLSLISSGDFFIYCNDKKASSKGRSETHFVINYSHQPTVIQPMQAANVSGFSEETMMQKATQMAQDMFTRLMDARELKEAKEKLATLTKENKELAAQVAAPMRQFIGEVMPYIGGIAESLGISKALAPALPISGVTPDNFIEDNEPPGPADTAEYERRLNAALEAFAEAFAARYPDRWITIVEQLTNTLHNSPEKIDMALKFL